MRNARDHPLVRGRVNRLKPQQKNVLADHYNTKYSGVRVEICNLPAPRHLRCAKKRHFPESKITSRFRSTRNTDARIPCASRLSGQAGIGAVSESPSTARYLASLTITSALGRRSPSIYKRTLVVVKIGRCLREYLSSNILTKFHRPYIRMGLATILPDSPECSSSTVEK